MLAGAGVPAQDNHAERKIVELIAPPPGCKPGERVSLQGEDILSYDPDPEVRTPC